MAVDEQQLMVCSVDDTDAGMTLEDVAAELKAERENPSMGIRTAIMSTYKLGEWMFKERHFGKGREARLGNAFAFMAYGIKYTKRGRKTVQIDVDEMVAKWVPAVIGLTLAHNKDEADNWEAQVDGLLKPLLSAPVKQLREFWPKLLAALKANPDCPFVVWRSFESWGKFFIDHAPDEKVIRLKKKLAGEIVELCEQTVLPQFPEAMIRALMWRDAEQLEEVKGALQKGAKPRIRGRESCLFLEVPTGRRGKYTTVQL